MKGAVPGRTVTVLAHRDTPNGGDLRSDLLAGQQPAQTRFGALRELDFDCLDRETVDVFEEPPQVEVTRRVAAAEVTGPDLSDQIAALIVIGRQATFPGAMQGSGQVGSLVQCGNGGSR